MTEPMLRNDGMIALIPADPAALTVDGGDPPEQIHLTLAYLGEHVDTWTEEQRDAVLLVVASLARYSSPVTATIFSHALWNVADDGGREPATVYELTEEDMHWIAELHGEVCWGVRTQIGTVMFPEQHEPFRPHVTAGYGVPVDSLTATGPVLFDRIRVALGGEITDYPLNGRNGLDTYTAVKGMKLMTKAVTAAAEVTTDGPDVAVPDITDGIPVLFPAVVVEGLHTSDGRYIEPGSLTTRALPLPILAQMANPDGGEGHDGAYVIGRMDTLVRIPGPDVIDKETGEPFPEGTFVWQATGELDPDHPATALVKRGYLTGNSADLVAVDAEMIYPDVDEDDEDGLANLFAAPTEIRLHAGVIAATTLVPIPAFASAYVQLDGQEIEPNVDNADEVIVAAAWRSEELGDATCLPCAAQEEGNPDSFGASPYGALVASLKLASRPDATLWDDPQLTGVTSPLIVDGPGGRVYGHLAPWGVCHIGYSNACVTAPHSASDYAHFRTGSVLADRDGDPVTLSTGVLTIGTGHADVIDYAGTSLTPRAAVEHYDNTGTAIADVTVGEDEHGIWVSGRVRPDATEAQCAALRAAPLSGDWRNIGGTLELVAALGVNTPGFRPSTRARVASGAVQSLVASGWSNRSVSTGDDVQRLADAVAERLKRMGLAITVDEARVDLGLAPTLTVRRQEALASLERLALEQRRRAALRVNVPAALIKKA